jgi:hypothetical protein
MIIYHLLKNNLSCIDLILIEGKMKEINGILINNKNTLIFLFKDKNIGNEFITFLLKQYNNIKLLYHYNNDVLILNTNNKYTNIIEILKLIIKYNIIKYLYFKFYIKFKLKLLYYIKFINIYYLNDYI